MYKQIGKLVCSRQIFNGQTSSMEAHYNKVIKQYYGLCNHYGE